MCVAEMDYLPGGLRVSMPGVQIIPRDRQVGRFEKLCRISGRVVV